MNFLFATLFMGFAAWNIHDGWYGFAAFMALASVPYLIAMGLSFFVKELLRDYVFKPMAAVDALMKEKEAEKDNAS